MLKKWLPVMLMLGALPAGATTAYNTLSAMQSANPGLTFTSVNLTTGTLPAPIFLTTGVTFQESSGDLTRVLNPAGWTGMVLKGVSDASTISIVLPTGATAFGGYFGALSGVTGNITITAAGNTNFSTTFTVSASTPQYWGIVSTVPFTSITVSNDFKTPALNNFAFGMPASSGGSGGSDVPEPSTLALMGGALTAIPLLARRFRK